MPVEIELKLSIAPTDIPKLYRHSRLNAAKIPQLADLFTIYYDTPGLALMQRHCALRVRKQGSDWIQTLKCGQSGADGLSTYAEWEVTLPNQQPNPALFCEAEAQALLPTDVANQLQAIFRTEFRRHSWLLDFHGSLIEVAIDEGSVYSGAHSTPISELELELKQGDPNLLKILADQLADGIHLSAEPRSKAARGYALYNTQHSSSSE